MSLDRKTAKQFGITFDAASRATIFEGKGCNHCRFTGYQGRTAIYEFIVLNEAIRKLIVSRVSAGDIKRAAQKNGMKTLRENGWEKIKKGLTTVSEVLRVTQEEDSL